MHPSQRKDGQILAQILEATECNYYCESWYAELSWSEYCEIRAIMLMAL